MLGGCCTLVPGVAAALRLAHSGPLGLAYIDGHIDTYDPHTSPTGEAADMPVAIVAGIGDRALVELGTVTPLVAPRHIALLAHRDEDEVRRLGGLLPDALGAGASHDAAAVQRDPGADRRRDCARPARAGRPLLALDRRRRALVRSRSARRPAQQEGGLSADELVALARPLAIDPACVGLDLVCYDVDLDDGARSLRHAARRARPADHGAVVASGGCDVPRVADPGQRREERGPGERDDDRRAPPPTRPPDGAEQRRGGARLERPELVRGADEHRLDRADAAAHLVRASRASPSSCGC